MTNIEFGSIFNQEQDSQVRVAEEFQAQAALTVATLQSRDQIVAQDPNRVAFVAREIAYFAEAARRRPFSHMAWND